MIVTNRRFREPGTTSAGAPRCGKRGGERLLLCEGRLGKEAENGRQNEHRDEEAHDGRPVTLNP